MKTTLIYEPTLTGHHLEYLHHYYLGALERKDRKFIFLVPKSFDCVKDKYTWEKASHIEFRYIDEKYSRCLTAKNIYRLGWNASRVLNDYVRSTHADEIILTMLMQFIPFIIFLLPRNVRVRGIMYKIYLYTEDKTSWLRLAAERMRFWLTARSKVVETVFVLNDEDSANRFNEIYNTAKFKFLPDPVPQVDVNSVKNIRQELGIPDNHTMYLHFGGLDKRKGTLDILNAIIATPSEMLKDKTFVFAGKQKESLRKEFYPLLEVAEQKTKVLVYDEFCSYEFLYNLCFSCDVVLMPYHLTNLSSGVLGYASLFGKPVIGPKYGLIGHLIKKYELGKVIDIPINADALQSVPTKLGLQDAYVRINQLDNFIKLIMK